MAESSSREVSRLFASDLRKIRESRGITLEALHEQTKIPYNLLDSFEQTGLSDHPMFNRVYLRSFVRTYADVIGLPAQAALEGLDEALDGTYSGQLGKEYFGGGEAEFTPAGAPAGSATLPADLASQAPPDRASETELVVPVRPHATGSDAYSLDVVHAEEVSADRIPPVHPVEFPEDRHIAPTESVVPVRETDPQGQPPQHGDRKPLEPESSISTVEPADGSSGARTIGDRQPDRLPPIESRGSAVQHRGAKSLSPGVRSGASRPASAKVIAIAAGIVVLAALVFLGSQYMSRSIVEDEDNAPGDTSAVATVPGGPSAAQATQPPQSLGDTISVTIIAASAPVQDIKVTVDADLRRPYWIEQGESRTFRATERIIIERQLPKIALQLEGKPYPTDQLDAQGRIVITRETAEQFVAGAR